MPECGSDRAVVVDVMYIVAALLSLVVEVKRRDRAAVERVLAAVELLQAVDMAETNEVEVCRREGRGVDHRLELTEKCRLAALHIAARDGCLVCRPMGTSASGFPTTRAGRCAR